VGKENDWPLFPSEKRASIKWKKKEKGKAAPVTPKKAQHTLLWRGQNTKSEPASSGGKLAHTHYYY